MPLVSVILPFYNAQETLHAATVSILEQSLTDFELLLVDNASDDQSPQIAEHLARTDDRISLLCEKKKGVVYASLHGLKNASGKYISRMDADDIAYDQKLEMQISFLEKHKEVGVVACCAEYGAKNAVVGTGLSRYVQWSNAIQSAEQISVNRFVESPIINPTAVFRREIIATHGFYAEGDFPEDYELWLRYLASGVKIVKLPDTLLRWNDSTTRLTRTDNKYSQELFYQIKAQYLAEHLKIAGINLNNVAIWGAGRVSRKRASLLNRHGIYPAFYIDIRENKRTNTISYLTLAYQPALFILSYVANWDARDKIRKHLINLGYTEGREFLCVS